MNPLEILMYQFVDLIVWLLFWVLMFAGGMAVFVFLGLVYYTVTGKKR